MYISYLGVLSAGAGAMVCQMLKLTIDSDGGEGEGGAVPSVVVAPLCVCCMSELCPLLSLAMAMWCVTGGPCCSEDDDGRCCTVR